jgi:hypothetical protein
VFLRLRRGLVAGTAAIALMGITWQWQRSAYGPPVSPPSRVALRELAEVEELHQAFALQQSLDARDGLLLLAPEWAERGR